MSLTDEEGGDIDSYLWEILYPLREITYSDSLSRRWGSAYSQKRFVTVSLSRVLVRRVMSLLRKYQKGVALHTASSVVIRGRETLPFLWVSSLWYSEPATGGYPLRVLRVRAYLRGRGSYDEKEEMGWESLSPYRYFRVSHYSFHRWWSYHYCLVWSMIFQILGWISEHFHL